ncbi:MAG: cysteine protease [Prevotella sp.]|nr:cysteine protease [Prevotella sp.]
MVFPQSGVLIGLLAMLLLMMGCTRKQDQTERRIPQGMHTDLLLRTTPVKDQGESTFCWIYATLGTIESERLQLGDSVNLSPTYLARMFLREKIRSYYLSGGKQKVSMRGMMTMCLHLLQKYGAQPYDYYVKLGKGQKDCGADGIAWTPLMRKAVRLADIAITRRSGLASLEKELDDLLDQELGFMPRYVHMYGATYSSQEFAHSVCLPGDYQALTSFLHHPFGEEFVLEVPDNQQQDCFLNIPIDTLMHRIVNSIRNGHPVCWEGDTNEPLSNGIYDVPAEVLSKLKTSSKQETSVAQQLRQKMFERFETTDDHCMTIVGLAHTPSGRRFFICKNSWGTDSGFNGFCYLSYEYVLLKTIAVMCK